MDEFTSHRRDKARQQKKADALKNGYIAAAQKALKQYSKKMATKGRIMDAGRANTVLGGQTLIDEGEDPVASLCDASAWLAEVLPGVEPVIVEVLLEPSANSMEVTAEQLEEAVKTGLSVAAAQVHEREDEEQSKKVDAQQLASVFASIVKQGEMPKLDTEQKVPIFVKEPLVDQVKVALEVFASQDTIKVFNGELCELIRDQVSNRFAFLPMQSRRVHEYLSAFCQGYTHTEEGLSRADIPFDLAQTVCARRRFAPVKAIRGIVETQMMRPSGSILDDFGYDEETKLYFPEKSLRVGVPENPSKEEIVEACEILREPWREFEFLYSEIDLAVAITPMITYFSLYQYHGPTPPVAYVASTPGTGKTLAADICAETITGSELSSQTLTDNDEEAAKQLVAYGRRSAPYVCFDNVTPGMLAGSSALLNAWTSPDRSFEGRVLGTNRMANVALNNVWMLTGNGITPNADAGRRMLFCQLTSSAEKPETRAFKRNESQLKQWVKDHRPELIRSCLIILRAYAVAGYPDQGLPALGSFGDWSRCVRSALVWAGFADPVASQAYVRDAGATFMDNLFDGMDKLDPEGLGKTAREIFAAKLSSGLLAEAIGSLKEDGFVRKINSLKGRVKEYEKDGAKMGRRLYSDKTDKGMAWYLVPVSADALQRWADERKWKDSRRERLFVWAFKGVK